MGSMKTDTWDSSISRGVVKGGNQDRLRGPLSVGGQKHW